VKFPSQNKVLLSHALAGALIGYWLLHPTTMLIYQYEFNPPSGPFQGVVISLMKRAFFSFDFSMLQMGIYFALLGGSLGLASGFYYRSLTKRDLLLRKQELELERNIRSLIEEGENETVEFKSSLRWDMKMENSNRELEKPALKTMAGFMNGRGGILIIGLGDEGEIVGIEKDYSTLKKKNRDGFEQYIMQLISNRLGTDLCPMVHVMFHVLGGKEICRINVEPSPRPVYLQDGKDIRYYLRTGNSTRELNVEEAIHHISMRSLKNRS